MTGGRSASWFTTWTALALPVGVLGGLGSLLAVMVRSLSFQRNATTWIFMIAVSSAVMSFFGCLARLAQAYHQQTYEYLPRLTELDEKLEEWRAFYHDAGYAGAEQEFFNHELPRVAVLAPRLRDRRG